MGMLVIDRNDCRVSLRGGVLQLRVPDQPVRHVPAALLERVVLRADTVLTSGVLTGLTALGVGILAMGGRRGDRIACVVGAPHKDVRQRVTQVRRLMDTEFRLVWVRHLLAAKLKSQQGLLRFALAHRPDMRKPLFDALETLASNREHLAVCQDVESMRGIEGAAAAAYFRAYTRLFAPSLEFAARRRRPPPDPVNACLSLGYTLLYGLAVEACHMQGLDPMLGYLHTPCHGRASLASDLMEPWRAPVDRLVWSLFRDQHLEAAHFGKDGSAACLLGKAGRSRFYAAWAEHCKPLRRALRRHARLATRALGDLAPELDAGSDEGIA